jgi:hypothetical protein
MPKRKRAVATYRRSSPSFNQKDPEIAGVPQSPMAAGAQAGVGWSETGKTSDARVYNLSDRPKQME